MNKKRSLDDTCNVFLSRRCRGVRSPLSVQQTASEFAHHAPTPCTKSIAPPSLFRTPELLELPGLYPTVLSTPSAKPLPRPGSSGILRPKPVRLANGRYHVPRPRNPFILFRCDLVHQRKELPRSDLDDTNISRIAGDLWREMSAAQKRPWVELAAQEKARHALLYPDYKYAPSHNLARGKKVKNESIYLEERPSRQVSNVGAASPPDNPKPQGRHTERPRPYPQPVPRRRSSSCPPVGAVPVAPQPPLDQWTPALVSQDDMQRRPSRTVMYQSVTQQAAAEPAAPTPIAHNQLLHPQGLDWLESQQINPPLLDSTYALPDPSQSSECYTAPNFGFFNNKLEPTFSTGVCDPGFTSQELADLERLAIGATFTDPFSALFTMPVNYDSPYTLCTAISPFDCSGYSPASPSSLSSGTY